MPRKNPNAVKTPTRSRKTRSARKSAQDGVPDIYHEMLAEEALSTPTTAETGRPSKRRKVSEEPIETPLLGPASVPSSTKEVKRESSEAIEHVEKLEQVIYDDFENSDVESETDFEDVELDLQAPINHASDKPSEPKSLKLDLTTPTTASDRNSTVRRKPVTKAERDLRLDIHKWHLLCLLLHLQCRNRWCESDEIQALLKPLIPRKIISMLHTKEDQPQYQQVHSFEKAIEEICSMWIREWKTTTQGLRRAYWRDKLDLEKEVDDAEDPIDFADFKSAAATRSGSRDLAAQLFCALLRSVAVETRLVCSLQPLPFSRVAKGKTPEKAKPNLVYYSVVRRQQQSSTSAGDPSNPRWRLSDHTQSGAPLSHPPSVPRKRIRDSPYPVFWVEVLLKANGTWIPLDPVVRHTINKPKTGFEPPLSDGLNAMSYVIAFEDDGSAKDVTRRYAQHYNSKTRKLRVESTRDGEKWWIRTMKWFQRFKYVYNVRDQIEDAELARREAAEEMPRNVVDFKGHPWYVLERHLRRNEVIWPRREVGKVNTGAEKLEVIYRRSDVHIVRSADQWYRKGRDVKEGEQPLKRVVPKNRRRGEMEEEEEDENADGTALYAEYQTEIYIPPPVIDGRIPKNVYGNLDVYVPSMIPAEGIHVKHPLAMKAVKILGIDAVDAVTGFDFKGRQGTAIINGVVVAGEYRESMIEVIEAMEHEQIQRLAEKRHLIALQKWKRLITGLRIRQKIEQEYADRDKEMQEEIDDDGGDDDGTYREEDDEDQGGGFLPETNKPPVDDRNDDEDAMDLPLTREKAQPQPIIIVESSHSLRPGTRTENGGDDITINKVGVSTSTGGGLESGGFMIDDRDEPAPPEDSVEDYDGLGGGFMIGEDEQGEGFLPGEEGDEDNGMPARSNEEAAPKGHFETLLSRRADIEVTNSATSQAVLNDDDAIMEKNDKAPEDTQPDEDKDSLMDENTSLLSHDPEDSDAEPEWMADLEDAD